MSLKAGIVGLPNVGKSTLFKALTKKQVESSNYAFTTIEPNISTVSVVDKRLNEIAKIIKPNKIVYATFDFVDIAGLVKGASKGEGLGNKFLSNIREVDAIIHVVRCFENKNILHVSNSIDPIRDKEDINLELLLADLETVNNILNRVEKKAKARDKFALLEKSISQRIKKALEENIPARELDFSDEEKKIINGYHLLSFKPILYVANVKPEQLQNINSDEIFNKFKSSLKEYEKVVPICAQIESELIDLSDEEKLEMLALYNISESGIESLTKKAFSLLQLETYFTAGVVEVRAWVYLKNSLAPKCAGIIHSDFEKKFIKAEVISYKDFIEHGGEANARSAGKLRLEGKSYVMQDGDICNFKFGK
ncbi:redox-regulated ATPase YchF [Mycoplasmopsis synoviae]|uniref:redox-regulated ATPase YchF n=1 Tax=Mycoplasmopsis synoviae TaxID=2109 RepID=UPI001C57EE4A|nr:redox-regulated ATPase YchF [Mycoplasmopsis synoviae]QXV99458.1 redox-regulated ATPase YchF [Mycoplasmopsis synoviae]UBM43636.1 redox-regulated ATPase YchF [Mycoplasmopsis synoviae]UZW63756.1 redox-regulated ATPase YchF [Mycoplasmopsis synoviae]